MENRESAWEKTSRSASSEDKFSRIKKISFIDTKQVGLDSSFLYRVIESLTHPFYVINVFDYSVVLANTAAGLKVDSGKTKCFELTHKRSFPCNGQGHRCPIRDVVDKMKPVVFEHTHYTDDGEPRFYEIHAYPLFDEDGQVVQIIEYDLDVTEQRWAERMLENETKRSRLFLDLLVHDMANQLQIIVGNIDLMRHGMNLMNRDDISRLVADIKDAVIRSNAVISKARGSEELKWTPLVSRNLNRAINEALSMLKEEFDGYSLHLDIKVKNAFVLADRFLEQLLLNLLENAIAHNPRHEKEIWVALSEVDEEYHLSIIDNGPGIHPDTITKLFNPNHRIGGLGLHFSQEIVEKYGGKIIIRHRVPHNYTEGTESLVTLPKLGCDIIDQAQ